MDWIRLIKAILIGLFIIVNLGILLTNVRKCGNCYYNNTNNI